LLILSCLSFLFVSISNILVEREMISDGVLFEPVVGVNDLSALFFSNKSELLPYIKACLMASLLAKGSF